MRGMIARAREKADGRSAFSVPTSWYVAAALALGVGVTAAFGGLAPVTRAVAEVPASEPLTNEILRVDVHGASAATQIGDSEAEDGSVYVVLAVTLTNLWTEPLPTVGSADRVKALPMGTEDALVLVEGLPDDVRVDIARADGGRGGVVLQPDLPVDTTLTWEVPTADVPAFLTLTVHEAIASRGSILVAYQNRFWDPGAATAQMRVPVTS